MEMRVLRPLAALLSAVLLVLHAAPPAQAAAFRVVLDPGHGGKDPGTSSPYIAQSEKVVVLRLAHYTEAALQRRGISVVLTRRGDQDVPLGERAALAQRVGAHAFVSLHLNAATNAQASGAEAWYGDGERHADLAGTLLGALSGTLRTHGMPVRGTRSGPQLAVLKTPVPATLIELGYATHSGDARLLGQESFLSSAAEALADGLVRFRDSRPAARATVVSASIGLPSTGFHFVRLGETLSAIASKTGIPVEDILGLNPHIAPQSLHVGQPVQLRTAANSQSPPRVAAPAAASSLATLPAGRSGTGFGTYTLAPGDTLSDVAVRFRVSTADLMQWNAIADANLIFAGKTILVQPPSGNATGTKAPSSASRYVVKPGDTLYSIARQWDISVEALSRHNGIA
ncbi:MAG TPA: N-acetylmuramoyl-L-alanine amidase, partial [Chloroflexota bacterium]|nr:N-acetylmuramoyl-L-alanine amidase [Chloroflexota bacterium]